MLTEIMCGVAVANVLLSFTFGNDWTPHSILIRNIHGALGWLGMAILLFEKIMR